jgi:hypothetical protein
VLLCRSKDFFATMPLGHNRTPAGVITFELWDQDTLQVREVHGHKLPGDPSSALFVSTAGGSSSGIVISMTPASTTAACWLAGCHLI